MEFRLHVHVHLQEEVIDFLKSFNHKLNKIMGTQSELVSQLNDVSAKLDKVAAESQATLDAVAELKAVIASQGEVSPELQAAVDKVAAQVQKVDDLVPDAPAPLPEPAPETPVEG